MASIKTVQESALCASCKAELTLTESELAKREGAKPGEAWCAECIKLEMHTRRLHCP